jgi:hypothetical protein
MVSWVRKNTEFAGTGIKIMLDRRQTEAVNWTSSFLRYVLAIPAPAGLTEKPNRIIQAADTLNAHADFPPKPFLDSQRR